MLEKEKSFLKKVLISIKDFEKYPELASKKSTIVLSYLLKLLIIFAIVISVINTYNLTKQIDIGLDFIKNDMPNFEFKDNKLLLENDNIIIKDFEKDFFVDSIMVIPNLQSDKTVDEYEQDFKDLNNLLIISKDKILLKTDYTTKMLEFNYLQILLNSQLPEFNKTDILETFTGTHYAFTCIGIFIVIFIYTYLLYFVSVSIDIVLLAIFGYITALMLRLRIRFNAMCKIAVHSLTLPIILNILVFIIESFTTFRIQYFEIMYIAVAYIYIITAILMIKADIIKNQKELTKIIEEQERIKQELERKEQEKKEQEQKENDEKKEKQNPEDDKKDDSGKKDDEPQGENA